MNKLKILLASNNEHKVEEYRNLLSFPNIEVYSLKDLSLDINPVEIGKTYKENAYIKAKALLPFTNFIILSDDSGIIIDKLGNDSPGIYSHRFYLNLGGIKKANEYLTKNCSGSSAHYTCSICILNLTIKPLYFEGYLYGSISNSIKGKNGFGYDPIFIPDGFNKTLGELTDIEKNKISHRFDALNKFINYLKENNFI